MTMFGYLQARIGELQKEITAEWFRGLTKE